MSSIVDFIEYKIKKQQQTDLSRNRKALYIDFNNGTISGSKDFGSRIIDMKGKIERLEVLLRQLKG